MKIEDTIVAEATPKGQGSISVIRLSGDKSLKMIENAVVGNGGKALKFKPRRAAIGNLISDDGKFIDRVVVTFFKAPHSYTGEDVAEVSLHGSPFIVKNAITVFLNLGARMAFPGEFTYRAFLNGKLPIGEAEAISSLIMSQSQIEAEIEGKNLTGRLDKKYKGIKKNIEEILSRITANIEFPDEGLKISFPKCKSELITIQNEISNLLASYNSVKPFRTGSEILILGPPNVGKSTLFNLLIGEDRAIISKTPGTTRDYIIEPALIKGLPVLLYDCAGIRASKGIEAKGGKKAMALLQKGRFVLWLIDLTKKIDEKCMPARELKTVPFIIVGNKKDIKKGKIPENLFGKNIIAISAKKAEGINILKKAIFSLICKGGREIFEKVVPSSERQAQILCDIEAILKRCKGFVNEESIDILCEELNDAYSKLNNLINPDMDTIYDNIFSKFCVGK